MNYEPLLKDRAILFGFKGNFPDWENWRKGNFLCSQKMENSKIKGNFPDWVNWRKGK